MDDPEKLVPQGIEGLVPYRGSVESVLTQFVGGLKFAMGYCGARHLAGLRELARFTRITFPCLPEAHPHDIKVIQHAPNYRPGH